MAKTKSFVTFKDGHTEDIIYYQKRGCNKVLFATESGVYKYIDNAIPFGIVGLSRQYEFWKLHLGANDTDFCHEAACDIQSITLDERVPYEYRIHGDLGYVTGSIIAPPNANEEEIKKLIMEDLEIEWRKE